MEEVSRIEAAGIQVPTELLDANSWIRSAVQTRTESQIG
jgi:hypothetical protein